MKIEFLWFSGCPSHQVARHLLADAMASQGITASVDDVDATDIAIAKRLKFPGSPTIRVNGVDIDPGYSDPGDYTPRCRLYLTSAGLQGLPERRWIEDALQNALTSEA